MLIEIDGIDGAGKTTQCSLLKKWIEQMEHETIVVKEPGGTEFGQALKGVIMSRIPRDKHAEMFAFLACKSQVYAQQIIPSLASGKYVISDRGAGSFLSYHNVAFGMHFKTLTTLMSIATLNTQPTATFILDLPVDVAMGRLNRKEGQSKFDRMGAAFFEKQRCVLLKLKKCFRNWVVIDGSLSIEEVHARLKKESSFFL